MIVDLAQARAERQPHLRGDAKCLACHHTWVAVAPTGTIWFDCPACSLERGRYVGAVQKDGNHWHCNCGNDLFRVTQDGYYCPNCGVDQVGF